MSAPIYKIKNKIEIPEATIDSFMARDDWNKEIANNKQGYMGVDIMPMKDFYEAGGYTFVDDYRAELQQIDAEYDRALPGYGVKGEQMAQAGLTGSGFGDYLSGQAYAARAKGQALARQNIMANSNSFRAAYNSYVTQQKEKREKNLQTVIDKAYNSAMDPEMFVEMATKLGIPQADAERGKGILEGYYMGFGAPASVKEQMQTLANNAYNLNLSGDAFKEYAKAFGLTNESYLTQAESMLNALYAGTVRNEYGLTEEEQTQASSLVQQIVQGVGTYANTDAIKNLLLATSTGKNTESIYNAALQQAKASVLAELQGKVANGGYVSEENLAKYKAYYGFTDEEFSAITTGMKEMEESGNIKLSPEQQMQVNSYADILNTALSDAIKNNTAFSLKTILGVNHLDENDPLVKAAIDDFQSIQAGAYEEQLAQGAFVSKKALDAAKSSRLISDEQYKDLLGKAQEQTAGKLLDAIKSDDMNKYIEVLSALGIDTTDISEDNAETLLVEAVDNAYKSGDITRAHKVAFDTELLKITTETIADQTDLNKFILSLNQRGKTSAEVRQYIEVKSSRITSNHAAGGELTAHLELPNGKEVKYKLYDVKNGYTDSEKEITQKLNSAISLSNQNMVIYNGKLYYKRDSQWQEASIAMDTAYSKSSSYITEALMYVIPNYKELQEKSEHTKKEIQNTLNVTQRRNPMRVVSK